MNTEATALTATEEVAAPDLEAIDPGSTPAAESAPPEATLPEVDPSGAPVEGSAPLEAPPEPALIAPEPPRYDPWAFRVDGTPVEVPGTHVDEHGVIQGLTLETFHNFLRPKYFGDRSQWQRRLQRYEQEIQALADENRPEVIRANEVSKRFAAILAMDPVDRDEELEKLHRDLPVIEARADAEAARKQAAAYRSESQERHQTETVQQVLPVLRDELSGYVGRALKSEALKDLGLDAKELEEALWEEYQLDNFKATKSGEESHFETPAGGVRFQYDRIDRFLLREANLVRREREAARQQIEKHQQELRAAQEAAAAAKRNAERLAPDRPVVPTVPAGGAPGGGESPKPWRDESLPFEERQRLWKEHARSSGIPL